MSDRVLTIDTAAQAEDLIARLELAYKVLLAARDQEFIGSLLGNYQRNARRPANQRLSASQWYWVNEKVKKAETGPEAAPAPIRETVEIGEMKGVIRLFETAKQHLKKPAIVLAVPLKGSEYPELIRIKPASKNGRAPNALSVTREDGVWLGFIHQDGQFELNGRERSGATAVIPNLRDFAADPVTGAKKSALLTGRCCFCHTPLKDERSTNVGYGPICAAHYDLPWGDETPEAPKRTRKAKIAAPAATPVATPAPAQPAATAQASDERTEADDGTPLDDAIYWPNGAGETPCTSRYAELVTEQSYLTTDHNRWHDIQNQLDCLREIGHLGKAVKYDRPDPLLALLAGSGVRSKGDGTWRVEGFEDQPVTIANPNAVLEFRQHR